MEKKKIITGILMGMLLFGIVSDHTLAAIFNVSAADFSFSPANINVTVGDTVKWNWSNGSHTTTCNGTLGTSLPSGAAPWDAGLTSGSPSFTYVVTVAGTYNYVCTRHAPGMAGTITATTSSIVPITQVVNSYELLQNFPNPFNPETNIVFSLPAAAQVSLKIYNIVGQEVETLVNERLNGGSYKVNWNASGFPSGVYIYKIQTGNFVETRKMTLIK